MERDPNLIDAGEFALDASPMVAREDGLIVPDYIDEQRRKREEVCFCGEPAVEVFRGYGLCQLCGPGVKRQWRRQNPKPVKMASSLKTRRS